MRARGRRVSLARREALWGLLFVSPWIAGFLLFSLGPIVATVWLSFTRYNVVQAPVWVGLRNSPATVHHRRPVRAKPAGDGAIRADARARVHRGRAAAGCARQPAGLGGGDLPGGVLPAFHTAAGGRLRALAVAAQPATRLHQPGVPRWLRHGAAQLAARRNLGAARGGGAQCLAGRADHDDLPRRVAGDSATNCRRPPRSTAPGRCAGLSPSRCR